MAERRAALIGFGLAGSVFHAPLIEAAPGLRLATIVTSNPERAGRARDPVPRTPRCVAGAEELWERAGRPRAGRHRHPERAPTRRSPQRAIELGLPVVVRQAAGAKRRGGAGPGRAGAEDRGVPLTVFHNRRWDSDQLTLRRLLDEGALGRGAPLRVPLRALAARAAPGRLARDHPSGGGRRPAARPRHASRRPGADAVRARGRGLRRGRVGPRRRERRRRRSSRSPTREASTATSGPHPVAAAPGPAPAGARERGRVRRRRARRPGGGAGRAASARDGGSWGADPRERWGRLVRGDDADPVPSENGAWPRFYEQLSAALEEGEPPPVDPRDAVATLEVLERARAGSS